MPPLFIYQAAFEFFDLRRAVAVSVSLFVPALLLSVAQIRIFTRSENRDVEPGAQIASPPTHRGAGRRNASSGGQGAIVGTF